MKLPTGTLEETLVGTRTDLDDLKDSYLIVCDTGISFYHNIDTNVNVVSQISEIICQILICFKA